MTSNLEWHLTIKSTEIDQVRNKLNFDFQIPKMVLQPKKAKKPPVPRRRYSKCRKS